jgi:hypothetical protein
MVLLEPVWPEIPCQVMWSRATNMTTPLWYPRVRATQGSSPINLELPREG